MTKVIIGRNPGCLPYIIGVVTDKQIYCSATYIYPVSLEHFKENFSTYANKEDFEYLLKEED